MSKLPDLDNARVAIVGLGYVGLPLAVEFGKSFKTVGFDINRGRIDELVAGHDSTLEVSAEELKESQNLSFAADLEKLIDCDVYILFDIKSVLPPDSVDGRL